jgi:hypothetical protein
LDWREREKEIKSMERIKGKDGMYGRRRRRRAFKV